MTLKELLKEAHLKGELYSGNLETGHYAEDFDEYYRHHELDLNKFELCVVGRSKPIEDNCSFDIEQEKIDRIKDLKTFVDVARDINLKQTIEDKTMS